MAFHLEKCNCHPLESLEEARYLGLTIGQHFKMEMPCK